MVDVFSRKPLIATFTTEKPNYKSWNCHSFPGVDALVNTLKTVHSPSIVSLQKLEKMEQALRQIASIKVVNPRGQAQFENDKTNTEELPTMDRLEVVFDETWADEMASSESFRLLMTQMTESAMAFTNAALSYKSYWRLLIAFPGTHTQKWFADDVESQDLIICEVELTGNGESQPVFPLDEEGHPVDLEGKHASEIQPRDAVIYSGDAIHFYKGIPQESSQSNVVLQLILSVNGDPNDCIPSDVDSSDFLENDDDILP